jgi:hypothetical protein
MAIVARGKRVRGLTEKEMIKKKMNQGGVVIRRLCILGV